MQGAKTCFSYRTSSSRTFASNENMRVEFKFVVMEPYEIEYRDESKMIAFIGSYGLVSFRCKEQNRYFSEQKNC